MARVNVTGVKIGKADVTITMQTTVQDMQQAAEMDHLCKTDISERVNQAFGSEWETKKPEKAKDTRKGKQESEDED
jgi:hypothetical protein